MALPAIFEMDPDKVPIADFPINRLQPISDFNEICYNASVDFVNGYGQGAVRESPGGKYCKESIKTLLRKVGKNPCQYKGIQPPIIRLRPKHFAIGLEKFDSDGDKALKYCVEASMKNNDNPNWCYASHTIFNNVYVPPKKIPDSLKNTKELYEKSQLQAVQTKINNTLRELTSATPDAEEKRGDIILICGIVLFTIGLLSFVYQQNK